MDGGEGKPPFCHHVSRHGAVKSSGNEDHGLSGGGDGHPAGSGDGSGVDVGSKVPDLYVDDDVGVVDVHGQVGEGVQKSASHFGGDLGGF